jgi:hypothetical protein
MSPGKSVDPVLAELDQLRREPVPTSFKLSVNQDRPDRQPELEPATAHSFVGCECNYEKALKRFDPEHNVISDGVFVLSILCSTDKAVKKAVMVYEKICKLDPPTQTTSREASLKSLIHEFAKQCEHLKILPKIVERPHHFIPYPIIPRCRVDEDGVPLMGSDTDSDEENERQDEPVVSNFQAVFAFNTIVSNALIEKLLHKLP